MRIVRVTEFYENDTFKTLLVKDKSGIFSVISHLNIDHLWPTKKNLFLFQILHDIDYEKTHCFNFKQKT